jgi:hypothetical protein
MAGIYSAFANITAVPISDFSDTTVVIPAKDEEAVYEVVKDVLRDLPGCRAMVLYNGYGGKALKFASPRVYAYPAPVGKGRAIIMMQRKRLLKTPILCFIDGDATYDPKDLRKMIPMVRQGYGMVLGNRLDGVSIESMPRWIEFGNRVITLVANILYGLNLRDSQTGLRAIDTKAFQALELTEPQFGIETEMDIKIKKMGLKIGELRAKYYIRKGETKQVKIGGIKHILIELKFLFYSPRTPGS